MDFENKPSAIYIDCTDTFFSGMHTGIQRVVNQIVSRELKLTETTGILCIPVVGVNGKYYRLDDIKNIKHFSGELQYFKQYIINKYYNIRMNRKYYNLTEKNQENSLLNKKNNIINSTKKILINISKIVLLKFQKFIFYIMTRSKEAVSFREMTLLLLPDAFWGRYYNFDSLTNFGPYKPIIIPLIHDLFPVTYPNFCGEESIKIFHSRFEKILEISSGIITVSKSGLKDIKEYIVSNYPKYACLPMRSFYLGADFYDINKINMIQKSNNKLLTKIESASFYLVVGTLEPKKDHQTVLEAFEKLWSMNYEFKLILVGKIGWKCENIFEKIKNSPFLNKQLFYLQNIKDSDLMFLYSKAKALIISSVAEGFGLPLVEAMGLGIPVIASDIPVFREIGDNYPVYFQCQSPSDLVRVIQKFHLTSTSSPSLAPTKTSKRWISWDDSAYSFIQTSLDIFNEGIKNRDSSGSRMGQEERCHQD